MRKIKFRQWLGRRKIMYYGIGAITDSHWASMPELNFDINPLMQYTGRRDKNGKEIYEGDVVRYKAGYRLSEEEDTPEEILEEKDVVTFIKGRFSPIPTFMYCEDYYYAWKYYDFEVLGNIYENPDLLEAK